MHSQQQVGESGGGKSSIVSLIQHLYEPSSGQVLLDGYDVHELAPAWLSKYVSVVQQQPTLFGRSIRQNIIYGLEDTPNEPSQEEIVAAAKLAHADTFIQKMPQKYVLLLVVKAFAVVGDYSVLTLLILIQSLFPLFYFHIQDMIQKLVRRVYSSAEGSARGLLLHGPLYANRRCFYWMKLPLVSTPIGSWSRVCNCRANKF